MFAHGLGGSSAETRPLASRLAGTRVLLTFRGHGRSAALPGGWDYDALAADLLAVADATGADRACGLSLGSGALLRLLAHDPHRFTRLACVLPAALDSARPDGATERVRRLGDAVDRADVAAVTALLLAEVPAASRDRRGVAALLGRRAVQLCEQPAPRPASSDRPVPHRDALAAVVVPTLVLAQRDDPLHSADVAADVADALRADLRVLPPGGVFWTAAREAQDLLADHLTPGAR